MMMNDFTPASTTGREFSELRLLSKGVGFLALLTGLIYLRSVMQQGLGDDRMVTWLFVFLAGATLGLFSTWRWEGVGGLITAVCGLCLAVVVFRATVDTPWFDAFLYSSPFVVAGGLALACWWRDR
jgi:hypothetical protein